MYIGILNKPSKELENCELTYMDRKPILFEKALQQHTHYASVLESIGVRVHQVEVNQSSPDSVFVEDVAIILDEIAIMTSMGTPSRRGELKEMETVISAFRSRLYHIHVPAAIEGGDVLRVGKTLFVGQSSRTNTAGIHALRDIVSRYGYEVVPVHVHGCLHLKTGVTALNDDTLIVNPKWIDTHPFRKFKCIEVVNGEPWAANVLRVDDQLIVNAAYPETAKIIRSLGYNVHEADISEFGKAEAGLTCMNLILSQ